MKKLLAPMILAAVTASIVPAAAQEQSWNWSGAYVGVHGGYAVDNDAARESNAFTPQPVAALLLQPGFVAGTFDRKATSRIETAIGGVHAGYNVQAGRVVFGAEADINFGNTSKEALASNGEILSGALNAFGANQLNMNVGDVISFGQRNTFAASHRIGPYGTVRGRLGVAFDRYLVYATAGVVVADLRTNASLTNTFEISDNIIAANPLFGLLAQSSNAQARVRKLGVGGVVGAGLEAQITSGWSFRTEYLYHSLPRQQIRVTLNGNTQTATFKNEFHVVRVGLSYRF